MTTASRHHRKWTVAEDRRLWATWGADLNKLAAEMGRTPEAIYDRAGKLGLPLGCPDGCETLSAAAKRTGYAREQLRDILAWSGHSRKTRATSRRGKRHQWIVDTFDVDESVERWAAYLRTTETIEEAARRYHVSHHCVRYALAHGGIELPEKPERGHHWRVPVDTVDAVMNRERRAA